MIPRAGRTAFLAALLGVALLAAAGPAAAHEADPRIVTTLDAVEPVLPPEVVVQVQAGIAAQLVASNPTATVLEVVGSDGRPFLRLSSAGVLADVGAAEFFSTSSPTAAVPRGVGDPEPRWVRISSGTSWGWYDHRLHPAEQSAPADPSRPAELGEFEVPLRYGTSAVTARGSVRFRPLLGSFLVSADPAPTGLSVQALPGRLPGLFLTADPGVDATVLGRGGEPFLRFTDAGVEVNERSRTHVEDRAARGETAGTPSTEPAFRLVSPGARSYTWLDVRLRYPEDLPPEPALRADGPTRLQRWEVPVLVADRPLAVTGAISWVPEAEAAATASGAAAEPTDPVPYAIGAGALLVLVVTVLGLRRRRRAQRIGETGGRRHTNAGRAAAEREEPPAAS